MSSLYLVNQQKVNLEEVFFDTVLEQQIQRFLSEYEHREALNKYDLPVANKIFLFGKSGCGKTMTAKAIANTLGKKIFIVNLSTIVSSKLGETARNLSQLFQTVKHKQAILFFDEFDSLGSVRDYDNNDASEMKRVVNTLLQLIDDFPKDSILIGATNQVQLIDEALLRRFDLHLEFAVPSEDVLDRFYDTILQKYPAEFQKIKRTYTCSFAEARTHAIQQVKELIIASEEAKKLDHL